ncbi:lysophospholipid acyltransferase family protein [Bombilactobacillus thymidiniphilus]|uniref:1-acyl-sn-glycerol-3-phosphate acyltransferase n=1 Tax=Bombilactobacillus thymidiniphilus TaxID=2923363 RepID=A0ABY4PBU1_9LACO|nr:1-acyl-sn-glycerol-3-phosphate acyltransferase [Bombilactobacillus thymidiniphilus]UQS83114.1 1-acyl-sn-glycerol-3-phosphate acyltransferase [Bombilactobacillus thymidiniphilus]
MMIDHFVDLGDRQPVIQNIQTNVRDEAWHAKVEINDPIMSLADEQQAISDFEQLLPTVKYRLNNHAARTIMNLAAATLSKSLQVTPNNNLPALKMPAIITSNHFSPIDSLLLRRGLQLRRMAIVIEPTNLKMPGVLGYLMNYTDTIPVSQSFTYMKKDFQSLITHTLHQQLPLLIYPEREMWFNYRKPRPLQRGAYYYAAKNQVPILSCFTAMYDAPTNKDPHAIRYELMVLKPILVDSSLSINAASEKMRQLDYQQKVAAYEQAYHKAFKPEFEAADIAGNYM